MAAKTLRGRGFTLVEALVIVVIIALVAALLFPALRKARDQASRVNCAANIRQLDQTLKQWSIDNGGTVPDNSQWTAAVASNLKVDSILYCPANSDASVGGITGSLATANSSSAASSAGNISKGTVPFAYPVIDYHPNSNNGHPLDWTVTTPDFLKGTITYQKNKPEQAILDFTRVHGNTWKMTVVRIDPRQPYGGPPIDVIFPDGSRINNLDTTSLGASYILNFGRGASSYGLNNQVVSLVNIRNSVPVLMDYSKIMIDFDGKNSNDDDGSISFVAPHSGKTNVLFSDSSIRLMSPRDLNPGTGVFGVQY